jgi:hypothetical protein
VLSHTIRRSTMLKSLATIALLVCLVTQAKAATVAIGMVTNVAVGLDNVAVYITGANGSPCGSGWFYMFTADSDDQTVNRITALAMTSWTTGTTVAIYGVSVICNQGTASRFTSMQTAN